MVNDWTRNLTKVCLTPHSMIKPLDLACAFHSPWEPIASWCQDCPSRSFWGVHFCKDKSFITKLSLSISGCVLHLQHLSSSIWDKLISSKSPSHYSTVCALGWEGPGTGTPFGIYLWTGWNAGKSFLSELWFFTLTFVFLFSACTFKSISASSLDKNHQR